MLSQKFLKIINEAKHFLQNGTSGPDGAAVTRPVEGEKKYGHGLVTHVVAHPTALAVEDKRGHVTHSHVVVSDLIYPSMKIYCSNMSLFQDNSG